MFFNSLAFFAFLSLVLPAVWLLHKRVMVRNQVLVLASYFFYGCWDWRFLSLIIVSTLIDFTCGRLLGHENKSRGARLLFLSCSVFANLGILACFKYFDFFVETALMFLNALGLENPGVWSLRIILPVGISFYTFQTLSYTIDCYRRDIEPERNLLNFALYVSFFPQLVAGPIERASTLLPQFGRPFPIRWHLISSGSFLVFGGLFKKVVCADNVGKVADIAFDSHEPSAAVVLLGVIAFSVQIYCDFSGYTDIARGVARCMGVDLMRNFDLPYLSVGPSDFWRRWHISLSTWLRDYLYIPLGGNRLGEARTYLNLMTTMVLGGLWHGAAWNFVVWGAYQGVLLCSTRLLSTRLSHFLPVPTEGFLGCGIHLVRVVIWMPFVCIGWWLFRVDGVSSASLMVRGVFGGELSNYSPIPDTLVLGLASSVLLLSFVQLLQFAFQDHYVVLKLPPTLRGAVYSLAILAFIFFGEYGGDAFIYFQF